MPSMLERIRRNQQRSHFMLYFLAFGIYGAVIAIPGPVIPFMAEKYALPETSFTFMFWARALGFILGGFLTKLLVKYLNYHQLMLYSGIGIGICFIFFPLTYSYWAQGLQILLAHIFCSIFEIILVMCYMEAFKGNEEEYWLQLSMASFGVFALVSPIIAGFIGEKSYMVIGIFIIVISCGFCMLVTPEKIKHEHLGQNHQEEMGITVVSKKAEVLLGFIIFFYYAEESGFSGWISSYSTISHLYAKEGSAFLVSLFWVTMTSFRLIFAGFSGTIYQKLKSLFYLRATFFALLIICSYIGLQKISAIMGCILIGIAYSSSYSLFFTLPLQYRRKLLPGQTANITICGTLGEGLLVTLQGKLMEWIGPSIFFPYLALLALGNFCILKLLKSELSQDSKKSLLKVEKDQEMREF